MNVTVCTPTRVEEHALRPVLGDRLLRSGVGRGAGVRTATSDRIRWADAVGVGGVCGGLDPRLHAGDVVVADAVLCEGQVVRRLPAAPLLAGQLRRLGLDAHVGPVATSRSPVSGAARRRLADRGALAVDMESAWLVPWDRPAAVVRVVADDATHPLLRPATLTRLRAALRQLPAVATGLDAWAEAVGGRRLLMAEPRSFCAGVERAIEVVRRALDKHGAPIYVRKQIVHNRHVVADLERHGAVFVDDLREVPDDATVVFSAHGVAPAVRRQASERGLHVIDATCPLVAKVHSEVRRFARRGDTVIFIGHAGHEETVGTMEERPDATVLVENVEDARRLQVADPQRVSYLVQTTLSAHDVEAVVEVLRSRFPALRGPGTEDICYATTNRQEALAAVAAESDLVLVVGSENSSNSQRLVETARRLGTTAHLVDDATDVDLGWLAGAHTVGITAGASAPPALLDELVAAIGGLGPVDVQNRQVVTEDVSFTLPKEVRTA